MEVSGKRTDTDGDVASVDKYCELCEADSVSTAANGYCKECEEFMCNACFRQHLRVKSCRDHTLLDTNASAEGMTRSNANAVQCKQHETETVKYYCRTHEVVGCGDCVVSKHGTCQPEFIKDLSDNFQQNEDYKTILKKVENQKHETNEFEKKIQESKNDNKLMLEKALRDIKQFRLDINKYLDKVETDITCQVNNIMEENDTLLSKLETDCTMISAKLEEIADMLNSEQYKDNVLFIHTVECKSKASECEKAISDMKSKSMKKYEFGGDQQLQSLVNSAQKLGTLSISTTVVFPKTAEPANEKGVNSFLAVGENVTDKSINAEQIPGPSVDPDLERPMPPSYPSFWDKPQHLGMEVTREMQRKPFELMLPYYTQPPISQMAMTAPRLPQTELWKTDESDVPDVTNINLETGSGDTSNDESYEVEPSLAIEETVRNTVGHKSKNAIETVLAPKGNVTDSTYYTKETPTSIFGAARQTLGVRPQSLKSKAAVGARVKHNDPFLAEFWGNGTVTAVHKDGWVTVKWSNGDSRKHRVGGGNYEVTLI